MDHPPVNKPSWLSAAAFQELLAKYGGAPRCEVTGETQNLSVDHIKPRYEGGSNDVSNLQFLANRINAKKGARPDARWSQQFYWDQMPDLNQFRGAQRELFLSIVDGYGHWFGRPLSQISTKLYINSWVVGAGKTLGIAATAWAINFVQRRELGISTRADKILVVTKEAALRDQIARDFEQDITRYDIFPYPPRVAVIEKGHQFGQTAWLDGHDVVVTCVQQLWSKNDNSKKREDIRQLLAQFPVIAFDEPHYGSDRIIDLVDDASQSACFGFTGTPINESGELLKRMVGLSVYGYETAVSLDGGLKYLNSDPMRSNQFVYELGIDEADIYRSGERATALDTTDDGYPKNIEPAKSVVQEVIARMKSRDQIDPTREVVAPHRFDDRFVMGGTYPSQGDNITLNETGKGTSAEYFTRRIVRDHPEIADRLEAGEFKSVRAAALEAGIAPRTLSVRLDDPASIARSLRKHMEPDAITELIRLLQGAAS